MKTEEDNSASCAVKQPKIFVMVYGAWSSSYAWDMIKPDLTNKGHEVIALQLPGHGSDNTDPKEISLDTYIDHVANVLSGMEEQVILVAHSMAGMIISGVAEKVPEKIDKLVYITAFMSCRADSQHMSYQQTINSLYWGHH